MTRHALLEAAGLRVKPLVWERHPKGFMASAGGVGQSYIFSLQPTGQYECIKGLMFSPRFDSSKAAQAAAQADYANRIAAAIEADPERRET